MRAERDMPSQLPKKALVVAVAIVVVFFVGMGIGSTTGRAFALKEA